MQPVKFEQEGPVGRITLAKPPYNRLDAAFARSLAEAVFAAGVAKIRVLLVTAEGPNFSLGGGADGVLELDTNMFRTAVTGFNESFRRIEGLRVPTVAAVRGLTFGGGFELALSCDFLVASETSIFKCVEATTGMIPIAGGAQRLCERVGRARASRYAMLAEDIPAAEAFEHGVVTHLVPDEDLEARAMALVEQLAVGPTLSYAATRTLLKAWSGGGVPLADAMTLDLSMDLFATEDCKRGFANTIEAYKKGLLPDPIVFHGR
jgi:enoyl-CoA hydratase/carnithine racemase